jgi:hypothetical protein
MELSDIPADCPLSRDTPFGITNVSHTQLSIARHYGGIGFNGQKYTYLPLTDELIRDDVLRWMTRRMKKAQAAAKQEVML